MAAATNSAAPYTRNGARRDSPTRPPPTSGPVTLPSRKLVAHSPVERPRSAGGVIRTSRASAETVNIVDPIPPSDRNSSNCQ